MFSKSFYITTPIYYPSGRPHMGHAYSSIIADIFARFKRIDEYSVMFLTGTDEHGLKMQREAEKKSKDTKLFCDELSSKFKDLTKTLNLSNDDFIRTTEKRHYKAVEEIWNRLVKSKDIYLSKYNGWYSVSDEAYYDEDEIETKDNIKCAKISGSKVEWVEEESYFFKLSGWQDKLLKFYTDNPKFILPLSRRNEVVQFVKKGLKDLSVSRTSFSWGIPVPKNSKHVIYVWLDALTNYLSALNFPNTKDKKYKRFWPATVHIIGKDILRFHAVYWPAFLMGAGLNVHKRVFAHGWWTVEGRKMSKSLHNVVEPFDLVDKFGLDQVRYFLLREVPFGSDGDFSEAALIQRVNSDLANDLGNLAQRVLSMIHQNCEAELPRPNAYIDSDNALLDHAHKLLQQIRDSVEQQAFHEALEKLWALVRAANAYVDHQAPWSLKKTDPVRMNTVLYVLAESLRHIAILIQPFMPNSASKVLDQLAVPLEARAFDSLGKNNSLTAGRVMPKPEGIFPRFVEDNVSRNSQAL